MAEDHQKLAVSNRQLAEENKRLQEVPPETLFLPGSLVALLSTYQGGACRSWGLPRLMPTSCSRRCLRRTPACSVQLQRCVWQYIGRSAAFCLGKVHVRTHVC